MIDLYEDKKEIISFDAKRVFYREMQKKVGNVEDWIDYTDEDGNNHKWYEKYRFTEQEKQRLINANRYKNGVYVSDEHLKIGLFEEGKNGQPN